MNLDPEFRQVAPRLRFSLSLKVALLKALRRPESKLKRMAADTIAIAKRMGARGLDDTTQDLVVVLKNSSDQSVHRAVAHALVVLDAREAADLLFQRRQSNSLRFAQVVEPALGRWGHQSILEEWQQRLSNPCPRAKLLLAINGLASAADRSSSEALQKLVVDEQKAMVVRLSAAKALAEIHEQGLVELARRLAASQGQASLENQLLAVSLLARHDDSRAIVLLRELAAKPDPQVVSTAMGRLYDIEPRLIFDVALTAIQHSDANIRLIGARALFTKRDIQAVQLLAPLLNDDIPNLRRQVAKWLYELAARDDLRDGVIAETTKVLSGDVWAGLEQACLILGALDHEPSADRFIELMAHERDEVMVSSAWALRRIQVAEALPEMFQRAKFVKELLGKLTRPGTPLPSGLIAQFSQLLQAFGVMRYTDADLLLRSLVPKQFAYGNDPRAAAIWSLGCLYEGQQDSDLSRQFVSRLNDVLDDPEVDEVRRQAAVSLGRMQAKDYLSSLHEHAIRGTINDFVGHGCHWAIQRITGEPLPEVVPTEVDRTSWFLVPLSQ